MHGQTSFNVHLVAAVLVIVAAILLRVSLLEWCLLLLCITAVLVAEMFNSALEWLAKSINLEYDHQIGNALDIASAAVLMAAIGAAVAGALIFIFRLGLWLEWWQVPWTG
jgi:diacylglycerol kinase